jgi:hypothetical protein
VAARRHDRARALAALKSRKKAGSQEPWSEEGGSGCDPISRANCSLIFELQSPIDELRSLPDVVNETSTSEHIDPSRVHQRQSKLRGRRP